MTARRIDIAILGGGLAGGLIALAVKHMRPGRRVLLIEAAEHCGGNHIWSFFRRDVSRLQDWLVTPLVVKRWRGYDVHFGGHSRHLTSTYSSITSERLDGVLREKLGDDELLTGTAVTDAGPTHVVLADGTRIEANAVIDARGGAAMPHLTGGWQKFAGQMLRLEAPHGLERPIVMDARVAQHDGYRFVYCLPFSPTEVFVEDTYYADDAALDLPLLHARIAEYAAAQGWRVAEVTRQEAAALPVIAAGDFAAFWQAGEQGIARAGTRAALVHPMTGYSLADAVRFACHIAEMRDLSGASLARASQEWAQTHWRRGGFYRMLGKMLFGAALPDNRHKVIERFYTLPEPLIERFYAGKSTAPDRLRVLTGIPPVPIGDAIASLVGRGFPLAPLGGNIR